MIVIFVSRPVIVSFNRSRHTRETSAWCWLFSIISIAIYVAFKRKERGADGLRKGDSYPGRGDGD